MRHRCKIERDNATGTSDWGGPNEPNWVTHLASLPCRTWFEADAEVIDGDKSAVIEARKIIVPLGTDVTEKDRVAEVKDRLGNVIFTGPAGVRAVGRRADHLELTVMEVS